MKYSKLLTSVYECLRFRKSVIRYSFVLLIFFQLCLVCSGLVPDGFRAAVVKIDITPDEPQMMAGCGARTAKSTGVHDRIFDRIVVFDNGTEQFIIVSSDLGKFSPSVYDQVAEQLQKQYGINPINFEWS